MHLSAFSTHACNDWSLEWQGVRNHKIKKTFFHSWSWGVSLMTVGVWWFNSFIYLFFFVWWGVWRKADVAANQSDWRQEQKWRRGGTEQQPFSPGSCLELDTTTNTAAWQGNLNGKVGRSVSEVGRTGCGVQADNLTWFLVCCCALSLLGCRGVSLGMGPIGVGCEKHKWQKCEANRLRNEGDGCDKWLQREQQRRDLIVQVWDFKAGGDEWADEWTHECFADPVVLVVKDVAVPVEQIGEELPQVIVIRLLKEVQPPHVAQVGGHLFCNERTRCQTRTKPRLETERGKRKRGCFYWPGKLSQSTSIGVARLVSPIFWYRSFKVSACRGKNKK